MARIAIKNLYKWSKLEVSYAKIGLLRIDPKLVLHSSNFKKVKKLRPFLRLSNEYISRRAKRIFIRRDFMKKLKSVLPIVIALVLLFSSVAFAASVSEHDTRGVNMLSLTGLGGTASCKASVAFPGKAIDATLELYQGSTLVAWWTKTGTSSVSFSEQAPFTSGLSYTLTISGTANGVAFTPASVTKTLW